MPLCSESGHAIVVAACQGQALRQLDFCPIEIAAVEVSGAEIQGCICLLFLVAKLFKPLQCCFEAGDALAPVASHVLHHAQIADDEGALEVILQRFTDGERLLRVRDRPFELPCV